MVLEDLHWADLGTTSMLFHLMRRLREQDVPILVIGSYRSQAVEEAPTGDRHPLRLVLREAPRFFADSLLDLSSAVGGKPGRAFVDAMIEQLRPDAPPSLGPTLFRQTAGLPLSVVALLRWRPEGRPWIEESAANSPIGPVGAVTLPSEIDALFAGLIDGLPPDLHPLLEAASVQGASFSAEVVMRALGLSQATAIEKLDAQLTRRFRVLDEGGVVTIAGQPSHEYQFAHALLRDYLYRRMSAFERDHHHLVSAIAMQELHGAGHHEADSRIAFYFDQAGDRERAAAAYVTAGEYFHARSQPQHGESYFQRAIELNMVGPNPELTVSALMGLGNCARTVGKVDDALHFYQRAERLATHQGHAQARANALMAMGWLHFDAGEMTRSAAQIDDAIEVLTGSSALSEAARAMTMYSHALHGQGAYDRAAACAAKAMELAVSSHSLPIVAASQIARANCLLNIGFYDEALALYLECLELCTGIPDAHRSRICRLNIAICHCERGNWTAASAAIQLLFDECNTVPPRPLATAEFDAGFIAEHNGRLELAEAHYRNSLDTRTHYLQPALAIDSVAGLVRVACAQDDIPMLAALLPNLESPLAEHRLVGVEHYGRLFVSLVEAYVLTADVLTALHHAERGWTFIIGRANNLTDPAQRESYLTRIPAHRRFFELAASLRGMKGLE